MEKRSFFKKRRTIMENMEMNKSFDYLKFAIYGTDDEKVVKEKDEGLKTLYLGIQYSEDSKYELAHKWLNKASEFFKNHKDELGESFAYFYLAELYENDGQLKKAYEYYENAHKLLEKNNNKMHFSTEKKLITLKMDIKSREDL